MVNLIQEMRAEMDEVSTRLARNDANVIEETRVKLQNYSSTLNRFAKELQNTETQYEKVKKEAKRLNLIVLAQQKALRRMGARSHIQSREVAAMHVQISDI